MQFLQVFPLFLPRSLLLVRKEAASRCAIATTDFADSAIQLSCLPRTGTTRHLQADSMSMASLLF